MLTRVSSSPNLERGRLPLFQNFRDSLASDILLAALQEYGRFYVLISDSLSTVIIRR